MTTLYATYRVPGDGVTTQFEFSFSGGYMDKSHVKAYIEDAVTLARTPIEVLPTMFVGDFTLNLGVAAPVGKNMVIYRDTPKSGPLVDFTTGSRLTEANLDKVAQQSVFIGAETADATNADVVAQLTTTAQAVLDAADEATTSAAAAQASEVSADTSEANALASANNAAASAASIIGAVASSAANAGAAAASATIATTKAAEASASASTADTRATAAAGSANAAAASATAAAGSASTASAQATAAASSATASASSATSASASAATATTQATNAGSSASAAAVSASSASASATTATTQAGVATTQAGIATTQAGNASASATSASTSATTATTQAGIATAQAGIATAQATSASTSAVSAASSAASAATALDNFDDRYLGPKATAPTLDNDGNALLIGALYFNTTTNAMQVYGSSGWTAAGSSVNGTSRRFRYIATAGQTTFTGADSNSNTLAYDAGYVDVYLNGSRLDQTDYTASSGTSIVLAVAAALNDELNIVAFGTFNVANMNGNDLQAGTVTYAKIQNVSTGKVLGRDTSGSGSVQELPLAFDATGNVSSAFIITGGSLQASGPPAGNLSASKWMVQNEGSSTMRSYACGADSATAGSWSHFAATSISAIREVFNASADGSFKFNSGYGSAATAYGVRAWANHIGTGTGTVFNGKGGLSSVTRTATGSFTYALSTAMPDANYTVQANSWQSVSTLNVDFNVNSLATTQFNVSYYENGTATNPNAGFITVVR